MRTVNAAGPGEPSWKKWLHVCDTRLVIEVGTLRRLSYGYQPGGMRFHGRGDTKFGRLGRLDGRLDTVASFRNK